MFKKNIKLITKSRIDNFILNNYFHESEFENFKKYLISKGWKIVVAKSIYEPIKAKKPKEKTIVLYQKRNSEYATIASNMYHAYSLIKEFKRR